MIRNVILMLVMYTKLTVVSGIYCLDCKFVSEPAQCNVAKKCNSGEECYMEKFVTGQQSIFYDLGCRSKSVCKSNVHHPFGRRNVNQEDKRSTLVTCSDCCNTTDICNIGGECGTKEVHQSNMDKYCFSCSHDTTNPEECERIVHCHSDSVCFIAHNTNSQGEAKWQHGCIPKQDCLLMTTSGNHSCVSCCNTNFCNNKCTAATTITTTISSTSVYPTSLSTPSSHPSQITVSIGKPSNTNVQVNPVHIKYGDTVRIACLATANPSPYVVFLFKGSFLEANMHEIQNLLIIQNYQPKDDGEYMCVAKNTYGSDLKTFNLKGRH